MMPTFFLAGLDPEGLEKLYKVLQDNDIDFVIDIRLSRGFDLGDALRELNGKHGGRIGYKWMRVFGNPHFDRDDPIDAYRGYLVGMDREMEELYELLIKRRSCIVDGETDHARSYRRFLAEALQKRYGITYADLTEAEKIVERSREGTA